MDPKIENIRCEHAVEVDRLIAVKGKLLDEKQTNIDFYNREIAKHKAEIADLQNEILKAEYKCNNAMRDIDTIIGACRERLARDVNKVINPNEEVCHEKD